MLQQLYQYWNMFLIGLIEPPVQSLVQSDFEQQDTE